MPNRENRGGGMMRRPAGMLGWPTGFGGWSMDPWREMAEMNRRMDEIFATIWGGALPTPSRQWLSEDGFEAEPDVDVVENDDEYVVYAALPGVKPSDVHVEATDNTIRVSAEYKSPWDSDGVEKQAEKAQSFRHHRQSRYSRQGTFQFTYTFPQELRAEMARADFNNGRLELHLPKMQAESDAGKPKQIQVNTGGGPKSKPIAGGQGTSGQPHPPMTVSTAPETPAGQLKGQTRQRGSSKRAA